ncbi:hypothetical protein HDU96_009782 [Phlyctochytrium bullatum]|nr:hypothetical protein HDU96_009782 [Phlyctochytrium bullatum]
MSTKEELIQWNQGCVAFDKGDYNQALSIFETIADTSKIHFNMAIALQNLRYSDDAIASLTRAIACDVYMAVAYFQRGVCFYLKGNFPECLADFTDSLAFLRGNLLIDYTQLGLNFRLYACEVSYNRGLCFAALGQIDAALADFDDAINTKPLDSADDYRRIDDAIANVQRCNVVCPPYQVPATCIYRPPAGKVKNAEKVNYLGKSKVVAAIDENDTFAGFSGTKLKAETLSRKANTKGPLDGDNFFSPDAKNTIPRAASVRREVQQPYASLSRRPTNYTTTTTPASQSGGPMPSDSPYLTQRGRAASPAREPASTPTFGRGGGGERFDDRPSRNATPEPRYEDNATPRRRPSEPGLGPAARGYPEGGYEDAYSEIVRQNTTTKLQRRNTAMSTASSSAFSSAGDKFPKTSIQQLKIKCHYTDTRILLVPVHITFDDLSARIQKKFGSPKPLRLKYKDPDNEFVLMTDQEDMEVAFELAGLEYGVVGGAVDRFDIWCFAA